MTFINPKKNGLNQVISGMPANESFDMVPAPVDDDRTKQVLKGMDETLDDEQVCITGWLEAGADTVSDVLDTAADQMRMLGLSISHYLRELEDAEVPEEVLSSTTCCSVTCEQANSCIDALLEVLQTSMLMCLIRPIAIRYGSTRT